MPGGRLHEGEDPRAGCARETLEETGWTVEPTALTGVYLLETGSLVRQGAADALAPVAYVLESTGSQFFQSLPRFFNRMDNGHARSTS